MMKIDLHVHTSEVSLCGRLTAEETIKLYQEAGYDAIVITNHFSQENEIEWRKKGINDFIKYYFEMQRYACELGEKYGLTVLPGYEFRFPGSVNDYLVYGFTEAHAEKCPNVLTMSVADFAGFAIENGILLYQAHPFRNQMQIVNPNFLFGIEVMNNHPRHDSRNDIAQMWAEKHRLRKIGGSDCHESGDQGTAGIETDYPVKNINNLIHVLKHNLYTIFSRDPNK